MSKKCKIMAGLAAAVLATGRMASANTITVTDFLSSGTDVNLAPKLVGTNSGGNVFQYQYDINVDGEANIQQNDGFVIYDVAGITAFGGSDGSLSLISGDNTVLAGFSTGLQVAASTGTQGLADATELAADLAAANPTYVDKVGVPNLVYVWMPTTTYVSNQNTDLLLSVFSNLGTPGNIFSEGLDFSGSTSSGGKNSGFSVESKPIVGPASVPEPASAGLLIVGSLGLMARRRRS